KTKLQQVANRSQPMDQNVVALLLKDHRAMKKLMATIKSPRSKAAKIFSNFKKLEKLVHSHMRAEETSLLHKLEGHNKFDDEVEEGIEEHHIHESVISGIHRLRDQGRKITQIKIFCEFLEHHLKEEETELFPMFNKYAALSTRKKMGATFMKRRKATQPRKGQKLGALA
ncbi:MAG: hemerythrin domain-containing protein, partial [Proteobacteria bacterium]|nr:hemerythrin domain-containing protein [Pseudomonadota bacterium]